MYSSSFELDNPKGTIPIPGVKNSHQVQDIAEAAGWNLTINEMEQLDLISVKLILLCNPDRFSAT